MKIFKNKKGQSAIELAIIFPILAMLMLYLFDVAMVINAKMTVNAACRAYIRTITLHGAPANRPEYSEGGQGIGNTAKKVANRILSQNSLSRNDNTSLKQFTAIHYNLPTKGDIKMHSNENPQGMFMGTMRICTDVPIKLSKVMGIPIWGEGNVKNGVLPVCSQYVTAVSSKSND